MKRARIRRLAGTLLAMGLLVASIAGTAGATPGDDDGSHKVRICHVTGSEGNPYVEVVVDVAAFDGEGANDHSRHVAKDGRVDILLADGESCPTLGGGVG